MPRLFLTGASGFVGRRVLLRLKQADFSDVTVLTRDPASLREACATGWRLVAGSLEEPAAWTKALAGADSVLHLAAATGKVRPQRQAAVTREGTRRLLEHAREAGVRRFLFVSSIAAGYAERRHYHYAEAKAAAEALVRQSGLDWLIVRPTLVLGGGSALLASLRRLALLPVPLLFGSGSQPVQPIHVDDLAELLVTALSLPTWGGRTIVAGGPERLSIEELMQRIRVSSGRSRARFHRLPLGPLRFTLGLFEPVLLPILPFTAGQLAFFANPSVAEPDPWRDRLPAPSRDVAAMLGESGGP